MRVSIAKPVRLLAGALAAGAALAPPLAAQQPPDDAPAGAASTAAPAGTVGPSELRTFSLPGRVTRQAEPVATAPAAPRSEPSARPAQAAPARSTGARQAPVRSRQPAAAPAAGEPVARRSVTIALGPADRPARAPILARPTLAPPSPGRSPQMRPVAAGPLSQPSFTPPPALGSQPVFGAPPPAISGSLPPDEDHPWLIALLLAALGIAGVAGSTYWRQRRATRLALAGTGSIEPLFGPSDSAIAPHPSARAPNLPPVPVPVPAELRSASASGARTAETGIVSTRLRPWLDLDFVADRLVLTADGALLHFECRVTNAGTVPAHELRVEATLLNAGEHQDRELRAFFQRPAPVVAPIPQVPPLGNVVLKSSVMLPRDAIREYHVEGRRLLVPLIGFSAFYRWSGGIGQSAASFLLGRGRPGDEKMAPFRLDLGPRIFRGLTQRRHTVGLRE